MKRCMMQHKISYEMFSHVGEYHTQNGIENQDSINVITNDQYAFAILSDGAGSSQYAKVAADTTVKAASQYCFENSNKAFLDNEKFAKSLIFEIQHKLDQTAKLLEAKLSEMTCTLVLLGIDTKNHTYFTIHIGDGLIAKKHDDNWEIISHPENGPSKQYTYFVNSPVVFKHTRVTAELFSKQDVFFISTDGYFQECNFLDQIIERINNGFLCQKDDVTYCKILPDLL